MENGLLSVDLSQPINSEESKKIENNITCWLPMTKTDSTLGSVKICTKTQTLQYYYLGTNDFYFKIIFDLSHNDT